jgi:hypothetical protein
MKLSTNKPKQLMGRSRPESQSLPRCSHLLKGLSIPCKYNDGVKGV